MKKLCSLKKNKPLPDIKWKIEPMAFDWAQLVGIVGDNKMRHSFNMTSTKSLRKAKRVLRKQFIELQTP